MLDIKLGTTGGGESKGVAEPPPGPPPPKALASFRPVEVPSHEEEEEGPNELSTLNLCFCKVSNKKLTASYNPVVSDAQHGNDVGSVQGNRPVPAHCLIYYFEITVQDKGERGCIAVGFSDRNFKVTRQPGWEPGSYGYHGDDGKIYHAQGRGVPFGPTFKTGDVVGAGINRETQEIFFTKNGKLLGTAFREVHGELFPTIGLHSKGEVVEVNFGATTFVFDLEAFVQEERERQQRALERIDLPLSMSHSVVRNYLLHYGYGDTFRAFDNPSHPSPSLQNGVAHQPLDGLEQRRHIRQLIREGALSAAENKIASWYPRVLQDSSTHVAFVLDCQKFVEFVRVGDLNQAVAFARKALSHYQGQGETQDAHLQDCLALLAYEDATDTPVAYLYSTSQREAVADVVNSAILAQAAHAPGTPQQPVLGRLLRQLVVCQAERRTANGDQGEVFSLHRIVGGTSWG